MKRKILFGFIALLSLPVLFYLFLLLQVLLQSSSVNSTSKNTTTQNYLTLVVSKEATIGKEIEVKLFYFPRLFRKYELMQIMFIDSLGSYDINTHIVLDKVVNGRLVYAHTLGFLPYYSKFTYVIPSHVCPQKIVYTSCSELETKKGIGKIRLSYKPQVRLLLYGEGYQGDGESLSVPIEIK